MKVSESNVGSDSKSNIDKKNPIIDANPMPSLLPLRSNEVNQKN